MMEGNEKAARYFAAVEPIYRKFLHGEGCPPNCICWREWRFRRQFKTTLYPKFQEEIDPVYQDIFGEAKEGSDA